MSDDRSGIEAEAERIAFDLRLDSDRRNSARGWQRIADRLSEEKPSSPERQIAFLKELVASPALTREFYDHPEQVARERGVQLDPQTIRVALEACVFNEPVSMEAQAHLGTSGVTTLADLNRSLASSGGAATVVVTAAQAVKLAVCSAILVVADLRSIVAGRFER